MSDILKTIANRIRQHRKSRGLTQVQLSQDSGVEHRHLQKIEAGTVDLRLGTISKIAKSLDVPAGVLLEDYMSVASVKEEGCPAHALRGLHFPVVAFDTSLVIKFVNPAFEQMLGHAEADLVNKSRINEFMADPNEAASALTVSEQLVKATPNPVPFYINLRRKDGRVTRRLLHWNYIVDESKAVRGYVCLYMDPDAPQPAGTFLEIV